MYIVERKEQWGEGKIVGKRPEVESRTTHLRARRAIGDYSPGSQRTVRHPILLERSCSEEGDGGEGGSPHAFNINSFPHEQTGWAAQIKNYRGVPLVNGQLPQHVQATREGKRWLKAITTLFEGETSSRKLQTLDPTGLPTLHYSDQNLRLSHYHPPLLIRQALFAHLHHPRARRTEAIPSYHSFRASQRTIIAILPLATSRNARFKRRPSIAITHRSSVFRSGTGSGGLPLPRLMSDQHLHTISRGRNVGLDR
ncbi:hypothetical protein E1B28_009329 [Marasmius oreades]|uniref:Uncharacterized protein n=1 Tax=Marasmius oreades TaxID=181124 RepID=A0A9P7UTA9_9AGAR|nr:uncharacterized protein E1B28_009329 [Marasmius oreades]KAG7093035.1 hypothetical protein E1B28_009329 [Marasmius oreades]